MNLEKQYEFDRLPRESVKAYTAFRVYLDLGPQRSLAATAAQVGKSKRMMEKWSRRHGWSSRVSAHSAHQAAVEREAMEALAKGKAAEWLRRDEELREQEWATRGEALALAREAIRRWMEQGGRCGTLEGIARLLESSSMLGHRGTGTPTERIEVTGEGGGPIRVEFEAALKKVYGDVVDVEVTSEVSSVNRHQLSVNSDQKSSPVASLPEKVEGK